MSQFLRKIAFLATALLLLPAVTFAQDFDKGPELDATKDYYTIIHTRFGNMYLRLYKEQAPLAVRNFVNLAEGTAEFEDPITKKTVKRPFYNGILFHRVMSGFMIQGGDPTATGMGGPGYTFEDEFAPELGFNVPGILGMANGGPNDNGSQFFITEGTPTHLNGVHTVFGALLAGSGSMEVVRTIGNVPRNPQNKPNKPVRMELVEIRRLEPGLSDAEALAKLTGAEVPAAETADSTEETETEAAE